MAFDAILWAKLKSSPTLVDGKIPSDQLPSYVDEIIEVATFEQLPATGDKSKIYYVTGTQKSYRWTGSTYLYVCSDSSELASKEELSNVEDQISEIAKDYVKKSDLSNFITEEEVNVKIDSIEIPSLDGYATEDFVESQIASIPAPDLSGLATEEFVEQAIANIEIPEIDLSDFALRAELPTQLSQLENDAGYITDIPANYITDAELNLTLSNSGFAKAVDVPTKVSQLENDSGYLTEHQDLTNYITSDELSDTVKDIPTRSDLETKADNILFTENYVVGTELGNFKIGDSLKNLSLRDILITMLNLTVKSDEPDLEITVDNIEATYITVGEEITDVNNTSVITDGTSASRYQSGVFTDSNGNIGYQIQTPEITYDRVPAIYIDPSYEVTAIQAFEPGSNQWLNSSDIDAWIWSESPTLQDVEINGVTTKMWVYTYDIDTYDEMGASQWRFIITRSSK